MATGPTPKGILLAGGRGTRLYPLTAVASKQLQPVYNKPLIYYPLTTLMLSGVRDILLISTPQDLPAFQRVLGDGSAWGIRLSYAEQPQPEGIAQALIIGRDFVADHPVFLMLGDNLLYGDYEFLRQAVATQPQGRFATIFGYMVRDPRAYGVVEFDAAGRAVSLEEKPAQPKSPWAVPGMYLYGPGVSELARTLKPSAKGELEITDLNRLYLQQQALRVVPIGRGVAWFDTGTPEHLLDASSFVHAIESRQGLLIGSPEECGLRMGYLTPMQFKAHVRRLPESDYRRYLEQLAPKD